MGDPDMEDQLSCSEKTANVIKVIAKALNARMAMLLVVVGLVLLFLVRNRTLYMYAQNALPSRKMRPVSKKNFNRERLNQGVSLSGEFRNLLMAETKSAVKKWEDMETDVLVKIFKELNMIELAPVSQVCRSWRLACSDPLLWNSLDLGLLKSNFIQTRASPYIWVDDRSDRKLTKLLRIAMALSRENITCLIFHFNLYMKDDHLGYIAERCPHLKRLVMPAWNRITKTGISQAIRRWEELESLTMPSIAHPPYIMEEISRSCKNFSSLKVMGTFDVMFASTIASNLPKLKILSVRCSILTNEALLFILDCMDHLEVLNISHCILLENLTVSGRKQNIRELNHTILEKASRLREFHHCMSASCSTCQRMIRDEGLMRWYRYEEWFWREDEVSSLALGGTYGKLFDEGCLNLGFRN